MNGEQRYCDFLTRIHVNTSCDVQIVKIGPLVQAAGPRAHKQQEICTIVKITARCALSM